MLSNVPEMTANFKQYRVLVHKHREHFQKMTFQCLYIKKSQLLLEYVKFATGVHPRNEESKFVPILYLREIRDIMK